MTRPPAWLIATTAIGAVLVAAEQASPGIIELAGRAAFKSLSMIGLIALSIMLITIGCVGLVALGWFAGKRWHYMQGRNEALQDVARKTGQHLRAVPDGDDAA